MPIQYKINVISALKEAGYSTYRLRKEKILAESTLQKFRNNEMVSWENLSTICELLNCQPGDLMKYIRDNQKPNKAILSLAMEVTSSAASISESPIPESQEATLSKKPEKQKKYYKHLSKTEADQINLQELLTNIKYQLDIADSYGTDILSSLLEKARQQTGELT